MFFHIINTTNLVLHAMCETQISTSQRKNNETRKIDKEIVRMIFNAKVNSCKQMHRMQ
jgi:hypothetical protein